MFEIVSVQNGSLHHDKIALSYPGLKILDTWPQQSDYSALFLYLYKSAIFNLLNFVYLTTTNDNIFHHSVQLQTSLLLYRQPSLTDVYLGSGRAVE